MNRKEIINKEMIMISRQKSKGLSGIMTNIKPFVASLFVAASFLAVHTPAEAGLITHFSFEGDSLIDSVGSVTATAFGTPTFTAGQNGQGRGILLDGTTDFLRAGINVNPAGMSQMTWGAWVNASLDSSVRQVLSIDDASPGDFDRSIGIDTRGGGGTGWSAFRGPTGSGVIGSGSRSVTTGQWTFLAVSYDESLQTMSFYVDGLAAITASTAFSTATNTFFDIGHNPAYGEFFSGVIDEIFVFDEALSAGEIEDIRLNGIGAVPELGTFSLLMIGVFIFGLKANNQTRQATS
ncbi:MAG: hypothetical protein methR_P0952 [Methyloprofundus sp.]|nr:MAG: hypothetical protein methR_P0952 [Methyloprofundus sp.]